MRIFNVLWLLTIMLGCSTQSKKNTALDKESQQRSHDLNLPSWGPYTKKYIGLSHIPDIQKGLRFDVSIFPGMAHKKTVVPNVMKKASFHPWEASPNLEYFSFRHDLIWKDKVFADISYTQIDAHARSFKIAYTNNTSEAQEVTAQLMASLHFPPLKPHDPETRIHYSTITLPEYALWIDGISYSELNYAIPGHRNDLVYDGMLRGEVRDHNLIDGSAIGKGFGRRNGDELIYRFTSLQALKNPILLLRYKTENREDAELALSGLVNNTILLQATDSLTIKQIPIEDIAPGEQALKIITKSKTRLIIDGFTVVEEKDIANVTLEKVVWKDAPMLIEGPSKNTLILKYDNTDTYYGLYWDQEDFVTREWFLKDLPDTLHKDDDGIKQIFKGDGEGHFTNIFIKPFELAQNASKIINGIVCEGSQEEVFQRLKNAANTDFEQVYATARTNIIADSIIPAGKKYVFGQDRMAANTICNVVYPVYTQNQYIRHHAPGRKWDCLYTWDAGFIGLGISEISIQRGMENLNAYLNEPEGQSAFIHHGTPLPVQFYQFHELWNKTQNDSLVRASYPKLKRYYDFLLGKVETSTMRNLGSGLLRTWDYFYNSGGWDDYPAQKHLHENKLQKKVTPVVSTAHAIRAAKILQMTANYLGINEDQIEFQEDINELSNALQEYSWDEASGYYGYVNHNLLNNASGILKYNGEINYNMGLGGASPIIAGITDEEQTKRIINHLKTEGELWSKMGLSTVDQSAPYFKEKGYWNGSVWMPHQWFFWKTMLDYGEDEFAYKIATTALDIWKRETEESYNCYEYFSIKEEKGLGWHQFSGLSSPVLNWFNAYYKVGTLSAGNNIWVNSKEWNKDYSELSASITVYSETNKHFSIVACVNPAYTYKVLWNNKEIQVKEFEKGLLSIPLNSSIKKGMLKIVRI